MANLANGWTLCRPGDCQTTESHKLVDDFSLFRQLGEYSDKLYDGNIRPGELAAQYGVWCDYFCESKSSKVSSGLLVTNVSVVVL